MKNRGIFRKISFLLIATLLMINLFAPISAAAPGQQTPMPTGVDGRILTPDLSGDVSDWLEIAQYGNSSLIVRMNYININTQRMWGGKTI